MNVLFICTANICRSPVAEHYLRHLGGVLGLNLLDVRSAGIIDMGGQPADPIAAKLARLRGVDLSPHRSRQVTDDDLRRADEVIVMERRHRAWLREHAPHALPKVSLLRSGQAAGDLDLVDPTGGKLSDYESAFATLFACVEQLALSVKYPR